MRDESIAVLKDALVCGQLTFDEFDERVELAHRARTDRELAALTSDLKLAVDAPVARYRVIRSQLVHRGAWRVPPRSSWLALFGTIVLDLRHARFAGDEVELRIRNVFGTVTVIVPASIALEVDGRGLFGRRVIDPPAWRPVPAGAPRMSIRVRGIGGGLYIRRSAARRLLETAIAYGRDGVSALAARVSPL